MWLCMLTLIMERHSLEWKEQGLFGGGVGEVFLVVRSHHELIRVRV